MHKRYFVKSTFKLILLFFVVVLMVLPFATAFNEFLTRVVEDLSFYKYIQKMFVPYMSGLVYGILRYLPGLSVSTFPFGVVVNGTDVGITWNCLGWQSFLLFMASSLVGLRGLYIARSKLLAFVFGLLGTFLVNIFRLVFTAALVGWWKGLFVILFHNYFSAFLTMVWLIFFWWFSYSFVLEAKE